MRSPSRRAALWTTLAAIDAALAARLLLRRGGWRMPEVRPGHGHDLAAALTTGDMAVIIPARNEAGTIAETLTAVTRAATTSSPVTRIVVVDDRSSDETAGCVQEWARGCGLAPIEFAANVTSWQLHRRCVLELIRGRPLARGWVGKAHAIAQGVERCPDAVWLLFLDADTRPRPDAFGALVGAAATAGADLLSVVTGQDLQTWWEKLFQPAIFGAIGLAFPPRAVNDPARPDVALANGQCILVRADIYRALGGHGAIGDSIVEDLALAQRFKEAGHRIVLADGRSVAVTRMYRRWSEFWEGWTKNLWAASGASLALAALGSATLIVGGAAPPLFAGLSLAKRQLPAAALWGLAAILLMVQRRQVDRFFALAPGWALLQPVGTAGLAAVVAGSALKVLRGETTWRGRTYDVAAIRRASPSSAIWRRLAGSLIGGRL